MNFQFLPINENGKWGFIDVNGNELIAPQFDAYTVHSNRKNRQLFDYLIVEKNNKVGIVDTSGTLVLPTIYESVAVLDILPLQFKVRTKEGVFPIDSAGTPLIDTPYDDIQLITDRYYAVKKGKTWGIHEINGKQVLPCKYYGFYMAQSISRQYVNDYFIYQGNEEGTQNGLLSLDGKVVLQPVYNIINFINNQLVSASLVKEEFSLYTTSGDSLGIIFQTVTRLMRDFIVLNKVFGKKTLFNLRTFQELQPKTNYKQYAYLSQKYIRAFNKDWHVIDTAGNVLLQAGYDSIVVFTDDLFLTKKYNRSKWGITKTGDSTILYSEYDFITELNTDGFAKVYKNKKQGLINAKAEIILPAEYDRIEKEDGQYRGYNGRTVSFFSANADGEITLVKQAKNVRSIRAGYTNKTKKRQPSAWSTSANLNLSSSFISNRNDLVILYKNNQRGFRQNSDQSTVLQPLYNLIARLPNSNLSTVYYTLEEPKNIFEHWSPILTVETLKIYQEKERRFIETDDIVGIRGADFETGKYAAYIRSDGSFGLIDRDGRIAKKEGKPMRFTYILPFSEGYAKVYLNGEMVVPNFSIGENPNIVTDSKALCINFGVTLRTLMETYDLKVEGSKWTYLDSTLTLIAPPIFISAQDFKNGAATCELPTGYGIISPQMDTLLSFKYSKIKRLKGFRSDSFYIVSIENQAPVLFNKKGEELMPERAYDKVYKLKNGYARVRLGDKWGFVNEDFKEVIECQFQLVRPFSEGWAAVRQDNQWHFIDTLGEIKISINKNIRDVGEFKNGMNWFRVGNKFGYISTERPIAIPPRFTKVTDFVNGVAVVKEKNGFGIIDQTGHFILKPSLKLIKAFSENGIATYQRLGSKLYGLMDSDGNFLTEPKFDMIGKFHNGYAKVKRNYLYGLIDENGQVIIPLKYEQVGEYYENLLAVKIRYKDWQYVDITGKVKIRGKFYSAFPFENGTAKVFIIEEKKPIEYYINKEGKLLFQDFEIENNKIVFYEEGIRGCSKPNLNSSGKMTSTNYYFLDSLENKLGETFKEIEPFQDGLAIVKTQKRTYGVIDRKGFYVVEPKYRKIFRQSDGQFKAIATKHYGVIEKDGTFILPAKYDKISKVMSKYIRYKKEEYVLKIENGDTVEYLDKNGDWLWKK